LKFSSGNRQIAIIASGIGLLDALYLAIIKFTQNRAMCVPGLGDCWTVNSSSYSSVYGIPLSILGAGAYLILLGLLFTRDKNFIKPELNDQLTLGISFSGFLYSIYLTYLEIAVIKAVCPFCVVSAIMMTIDFVCSLNRLVQNQSDHKISVEEKNG
jgi:uncharacterized membrane protein